MSLAFAKLDLSNEVSSEHVNQASTFLGRCYRSIGFEIGRDDMSEISGQNTRRKKKLVEYIESASDSNVEVQKIVDELELKEEDVESIIDKMKKEGELWEPKPGYVKEV